MTANVYPLADRHKVSINDDVRVWLDRLIGAWDDAYAAGRDDESAGRPVRRNPYCDSGYRRGDTA
jgi:hypothetical protein